MGNFYALLSSADFFLNQLFRKILSGIQSESNSLDPGQALIWVQNVCKGYQQMKKDGNHDFTCV